MPELESYVTKQNPSVDDWLAYNSDLFSPLKGGNAVNTHKYASLVDVDLHAAELNLSTEDYFAQVRKRVGSLGRAGLQLVHSEMDDAWHIIVAPTDESTI